jgi:hypothetical protein
MMPLRRRIQGLTPDEIRNLPKEDLAQPALMSDFTAALQRIQSSVSASDIRRYEEWMKEFGMRANLNLCLVKNNFLFLFRECIVLAM